MKVLTSAAALLFLGKEYQFKTSVYYTGAIVNKTLYGDLYVEGGFDPDFTSADLDSLIFQIESLGIKEISGSLIGDGSRTDSMFWGQGWMWDDDPSTDSPYLSAFAVNDNAIKITVKGGNPGSPAIIETDPVTNYVEIINQTETVLSGGQNDFYVTRDWLNRSNAIIVKGKVSGGYNRVGPPSFVRLNIFRPENYFMMLLEEGLLRKGITVGGGQKFERLSSTAVPVYTFNRSYDTVIVNLNKISDNLSAEMTLLALGENIFGNPSNARKGIRLIDSMITLAGLAPQTYRLVDGSGLSHYNLVSAELMVEVLKYIFITSRVFFKGFTLLFRLPELTELSAEECIIQKLPKMFMQKPER
jgi:serine-type D-Ala-D-Ala carboxypeptidase/endopeptidase (penicillin-binding protein 4)